MSARRPFKITKPVVVQQESVFKNLTQPSKTMIKFQLAPTDVAYANVLRRIILTEVESVAFRSHILEDGSTSDIKVSKNSTPMSNEMLAHRIGLIPNRSSWLWLVVTGSPTRHSVAWTLLE